MLRLAAPADLSDIDALLRGAGLPSSGVSEHLDTFVVFESGGSIAGVGGLEMCGSEALLRSLAVAPAFRRRGIAASICDRLEAIAESRGVEQLYLLTETAERYFVKRGYAVTARSEAPSAIASTEEFTLLCPQSAIMLRRSI
jgi:amino-acid N-acetyltransferase